MQEFNSFVTLYQASLERGFQGEFSTITGLNEAEKLAFIQCFICDWQRVNTVQSSAHSGRIILIHSDSKYLAGIDELLNSNSHGRLESIDIEALSFWGFQRYLQQNHIRAARLRAMSSLALRDGSASCLFTASFASLMQTSTDPETFRQTVIGLKQGAEYDLDQLVKGLQERGYQLVDQVEEPGQYAIRGGILDVFSASEPSASRLEFFGDTLHKIKLFSIDTQISTGEVERLWISSIYEEVFPLVRRRDDAQRFYEALLEQPISSPDRQGMVDAFTAGHFVKELQLFLPALRLAQGHALLDFLQTEDRLIFLEPIALCLEKYQKSFDRWQAEFQDDMDAKRPALPPVQHFFSPTKIKQKLRKHLHGFEFGLPLDGEPATFELKSSWPKTQEFPHLSDKSALQQWTEYFKNLAQRSLRALVLVRQPEHLLRVRSVLQHHSIDFEQSDLKLTDFLRADPANKKSSVMVAIGSLPQLLWDEVLGLVVVPEHLMFGEPFQAVQRRTTRKENAFKSFQDLEINALVVHSEHGVARYLGMRSMDLGGILTDFLVLEYADQDRLYLPVHRLNLLQKYSSQSSAASALDKLKSQTWAKRKARAKKSVKDMADQLLRLYAQRKLSERPPFSALSDIYFQFEADFPYSETADQQKAIDEVHADLSRSLPMDRLICGDVGFGKTEIALRAAMRVALEGMQIMVLAPTTLLSYQHYETFKKRFKPYGVEIALANRFVRADKIKTSLQRFSAGSVDILIGTHRLLSKDVQPKNLGLLIVDEEQRFGVSHKETIKSIKAACDIMTLTATPIPRSLHMSLLGIRDISVIATPPVERLAIKTYIAQFQVDLIKKAILQEVQRQGQIFFVHNRVVDIDEVAAFLRKLLPDTPMAIAHGQMKEESIEKTMIDFLQQRFSVLICTTIIESGIDMPNVNTIIVNNADKFGLAQLYQMRGRVGRSSRQSYAYFLTQGQLADRDDARRRLEILAAHQDLGAGFQIASYDMEMRGTGNILGSEQSGHAEDVGYETYLDMLEREIAAMRGEEKEPEFDPEIKLTLAASLPAAYIPVERQRLMLYKNLFSSKSIDEVGRLRKETEDRFGKLPSEAYNLFQVADLKVLLRLLRMEQVHQLKPGVFEFRMVQLKAEHIQKLTQISSAKPEQFHLTADFRLLMYTKSLTGISSQLQEIIEALYPLTLES